LAALTALAVSAACVAYLPLAARRLQRADNVRLVLMERAPLLGRAVRVAVMMAPPDVDEGDTLDGERLAADGRPAAVCPRPPRVRVARPALAQLLRRWTGPDRDIVT
jgi:hypothetical protein